MSSGHASDLDEEAEAHPSALIPGQAPPNLTKRQVSSSRDSYIQQLEQLNMRNMEHTREVETQRTKTNGQQQQHLLTNILAMESISSRLPPPSPAPEAPGPDQGHNVAAAIKDIRNGTLATESDAILVTPAPLKKLVADIIDVDEFKKFRVRPYVNRQQYSADNKKKRRQPTTTTTAPTTTTGATTMSTIATTTKKTIITVNPHQLNKSTMNSPFSRRKTPTPFNLL